jgi:hypothetical protein
LAITGIDTECPGVFGDLDQEHTVIDGILYPGGWIETVLQQLRQNLHIIKGVITIGEHRPQTIGIEPAKEGLPLLAFLLDPVVQVPSLKLCRTSGQVGIWYPQPIGQQPLRRGSHFNLLAGHPHLGQAVELHFL